MQEPSPTPSPEHGARFLVGILIIVGALLAFATCMFTPLPGLLYVVVAGS